MQSEFTDSMLDNRDYAFQLNSVLFIFKFKSNDKSLYSNIISEWSSIKKNVIILTTLYTLINRIMIKSFSISTTEF